MDKKFIISGSILFVFGSVLTLICNDFVDTHLGIMFLSLDNVLSFRIDKYFESVVNLTLSWLLLFPFWICWTMGMLGIAIGLDD